MADSPKKPTSLAPTPSTTPVAAPLPVQVVDVVNVVDMSNVTVTYAVSRQELLTTHHQSISPELMTSLVQQSNAQKEIAHSKYAVPALQQTRQVAIIAAAVVAVVALGIYGAITAPIAAAAIATMVSVIGVVFGGVYYVTKKPQKAEQPELPHGGEE